jgi:hypothetical protein
MLKTFDIAPGVIKDNTEVLSEGFWSDADKVRFRNVAGKSQPEVVGGQQDATEQVLDGKCRAMHEWEGLSGEKWVALGTSTTLYVFAQDFLWNITPIASEGTLANVMTTAAGTAAVTITHTAHGLATGDRAYLHNATAAGGISFGTTSTLAMDPMQSQDGSTQITVAHPTHTLSDGNVAIFSGASAFAGVGATAINMAHSILTIDADTYVIDVGVTANQNTLGGGTPTVTGLKAYTVAVVDDDTYTVTAATASATVSAAGGTLTYKYEIPAGFAKTVVASGYSTGGYSEGGYSGYSGTQDPLARAWSFSNQGQNLVANYREGKLYRWTGNLSQRAVVNAATDAPAKTLTHMTTPERFLMCLGTEDGLTSTFDRMLIAWATQEGGFTTGDWTPAATNTAGDFRLAEGARIVRGLPMPFVSLVWTDTAVYQAQYLQDTTYVWGFTLVGPAAGLIGSNAVARASDGAVYWLSTNREFMVWRGGTPQIVPCPNRDWLFDLLEPQQEALIYAGLNDKFSEIWWFFPDADAAENSRYLAYNYLEGHWTIGTFDITAWVARGSGENPLAAHADGSVKIQEYGTSDNGAAFTAYVESSLFDLGDGDTHMMVKRMVPDFSGLSGTVEVSIISRLWPTDDDTVTSAGTVNSSTQKLDFRVTARHIGVKFQSSTTPNSWRLGRLLLDVVPTGRTR